jgi:Lhr-like helicase
VDVITVEPMVEETYPYYGLRLRYREGVLEYVGGKNASDELKKCYNNVWRTDYNGCQTKTFMYCL